MAAKKASCFGMILSTAFTSFVAPILVNLILDRCRSQEAAAARPSAAREPAAPAANPSTLADRFWLTAYGVGDIPEEAVRDALRNALRTTIAGLEAGTHRDSRELLEVAERHSGAIVLRYEVSASWRAWQGGRWAYGETVIVELDRRALRDRLSTASVSRGEWNRPGVAAPANGG